ncbi:hypothetical protein GCM10022232_57830 [Streptomyces plumbiresistens]|uniref:Uncharacterized protein n=1 Tax=Streptomyces plumbiresistens TaxID=511811 RepID=A0ABP7SBJ3_9ACTN
MRFLVVRDAVLDFGVRIDHGSRAVEDVDKGFGAVLDEPLAGRGQHGCVQELVAYEHLRSGGGLGGGRWVHTRVVTGRNGGSLQCGGGGPAEAGPPDG